TGSLADPHLSDLFVSKLSGAFSYLPTSGYNANTNLEPGVGYWLKFNRGEDSSDLDGQPLPKDTISLAAGWNLIGSLGVPVPLGTIGEIPPGVIAGPFYTYTVNNRRYEIADSLRPRYGYWVKAAQAGKIVLDPQAANNLHKDVTPEVSTILGEASSLIVR